MTLRSGYCTLHRADIEKFDESVIFTIDELHEEIAKPLRVDLAEVRMVEDLFQDDTTQKCTEVSEVCPEQCGVEEDRTGVPHDL